MKPATQLLAIFCSPRPSPTLTHREHRQGGRVHAHQSQADEQGEDREQGLHHPDGDDAQAEYRGGAGPSGDALDQPRNQGRRPR